MKPTGSSSFWNNWKWRFFNSDFPCKKKELAVQWWSSLQNCDQCPPIDKLIATISAKCTSSPPLALDVCSAKCCDGGVLNATQRTGHRQSKGSLLQPEQKYCMLLFFPLSALWPDLSFSQKKIDDAHSRLCVLLCTFRACILQPVQKFSIYYRPGMCITWHKVYNGQQQYVSGHLGHILDGQKGSQGLI
jgi:hypothetical protein